MLVEERNKAFTVRRLDQVQHLVDDHILHEILRFLHEFGIEADVPRTVIAAPPLRFHALEEVAGYRHAELRLPLSDKWGNCLMQ